MMGWSTLKPNPLKLLWAMPAAALFCMLALVSLACLLFFSTVNGQEKDRVEKDLLGEKKIPAEALELTGHKKGEYQFVDPHDHLNMSQSTNESYPTAIKVAFLLRNDKLIEELQRLVVSFRLKGDAFREIVKMGRTEMQDAVPMTVGQEFHSFATGMETEIQLLRDSEKYLYSVNMGATAIGTGINVPKGYPEKCAAHLARLTGKPIVPASEMITATWDQQGFVVNSGALMSLAVKPSKIASDLILLASGPRAGLFEINLPAMQMNTKYKETSEGGLAVSLVLC